MKSSVIFLLIFTALAGVVFGQAKEITEDEFRQAFQKAYEKLSEISYREKSVEEIYDDGKLSATVDNVTEFIPPDKYRYITVETFGEKSRRSEMIDIGGIFYCREDEGQWTRPENGCLGGGAGSGRIPAVDQKITFEETKLDDADAKLYQEYMTYLYPKDKLSYNLDKFWINDKGLILRREMEDGSVEPRFLRSRRTVTYEYNPKIKIEAPVK
jgi:hypothetical protein